MKLPMDTKKKKRRVAKLLTCLALAASFIMTSEWSSFSTSRSRTLSEQEEEEEKGTTNTNPYDVKIALILPSDQPDPEPQAIQDGLFLQDQTLFKEAHLDRPVCLIPRDLFSSFDEWKEKSTELARNISTSEFPSVKNPFTFLHQRKAGGSSLRQTVYDGAHDNLGLSKESLWIPCHTADCIDFDKPPREIKAVYASHVNYINVLKSIREGDPKRGNIEKFQEKGVLKNGAQTVFYHIDDENHLFDCMTNLRSTVSRVVSCWNYRMVQSALPAWKTSPANELSSEDWERFLPEAYDQYNNGCNNEVARIFGSLNDESDINTLSPNDPIFLHEFNKIASRMSRCVILIPERCEDSNKVISHYFPWMGEVSDLCHSHLNPSTGAKSSKDLQDGAADAILSQNVMDELLFQFGLTLFDEQVRIANEAEETVSLVQGKIGDAAVAEKRD